MGNTHKLKVFASLAEDINAGLVWLPNSIIQDRSTIELRNKESDKTVYCEALSLGDNFLNRYNQKGRLNIDKPQAAIVINEWYRKRLGNIETQHENDFDIKVKNDLFTKLRACLQHPQIVVRIATWLGIISVTLGLISVIPI